jgi:hypothetical protein
MVGPSSLPVRHAGVADGERCAQETADERAQAWHFGLVSDGAREWARRARELADYRQARARRLGLMFPRCMWRGVLGDAGSGLP